MRKILAGLAVGLLLATGCTGMVETLHAQTDSEVFGGGDAGAPSPDTFVQGPRQLGDPCQEGECGADLACVAELCRQLCVQLDCNAQAALCAAGEACVGSDSVPEVCLPAEANEGDECGGETLCVGGTTCVQIDDRVPRCAKLCELGCTGSQTCSKTLGDCEVCTL